MPEAVFETVQAGGMVMFFLLFLVLAGKAKNAWEDLARIAVVAGALQALVGILQSYGIDPLGLSFANAAVGTHANANQFGSALLLMLPLVVYALIRLPLPWKVAVGMSAALPQNRQAHQKQYHSPQQKSQPNRTRTRAKHPQQHHRRTHASNHLPGKW